MERPHHNTAFIESAIARAHRALNFARDEASTWRDLGVHDDLQLILIELERLQMSLLKKPTGKFD